ncbi:MAG: hypothetical protein CVU46_00555 [Chloroflexi bacterium HGW-Chloroflexi-8]|nr:MAG: hypothetical protein CVU46_00555 [Chloroflexi bacterium HGW-Chloroflexi-8]
MILSIIISGLLALYAFRKRRLALAKSFLLLMIFTSLWTVCYVLGLSSRTLEGKIFWLRVKYIPATITPILWFYFSLQFTRENEWFKNQKLRIAAIIYVIITMIVVFSSDFHGFMWEKVCIDPSLLEEVVIHGFYFWVYIVVSFLALFISFVNYTKYYLRSSKVYKRQALTMLLGSIVPMVVSTLFLIFNFDIVPQLDESILSFLISNVLFSWSLFGFRAFEIIPFAHDLVIRNMNMGMLVFDFNNMLVEINPLAQKLLQIKSDEVIGKSAEMIFNKNDDIFIKNDIIEDVELEIHQSNENQDRYLSIHQSPIFNKKYEFFGRVMLITDITERKKNDIILNNFATIDELTKIYNRRFFYSLAEKELSRAKRYHRPFSIVIFDIDNFKMFNDIYGHSIGDEVIYHVASTIKYTIRSSDLFGRFGGDEFICLFPETSENSSILTVERIQDVLKKNVFLCENQGFPITMSFGIVHWNGDLDATLESLIKNADFALLEAKQFGKDCYKIWEELSLQEE